MGELDVVQLDTAPSPGIRAAQRLISSCIQCGACSSTCPTAPVMDYTPRHLWRMVEAGLTDEVLNSSTFWFCTSCYACTNQCPRGIHPGETMLRLKQAVAEGEGGVMPENMARFGNTVVEYHNISGEANDTRLIWMENLDETERPAGRIGRRDASTRPATAFPRLLCKLWVAQGWISLCWAAKNGVAATPFSTPAWSERWQKSLNTT